MRNHGGLRLTEIKDALGLPVSSVHNMLQTMVAAEMLTVTEDLLYSVGPRAVGIALSIVASLDVRVLARRPMQDLANSIGDDVYLGMSLGKRVFYADRCMGTQRISLDIRLGESLSLHSTATGKLFAAFNPDLSAKVLAAPLRKLTSRTITDAQALATEYRRIRGRGYAKSQEEAAEGIVGYAVPIREAAGNVAAAIHVSVIGGRATPAHENQLIAQAQHCARLVERSLGHSQASH